MLTISIFFFRLASFLLFLSHKCTNLGVSLREDINAHSVDFKLATAGLADFNTAAVEAKVGRIMPEIVSHSNAFHYFD